MGGKCEEACSVLGTTDEPAQIGTRTDRTRQRTAGPKTAGGGAPRPEEQEERRARRPQDYSF
jgi:hypothetical protein